MAATEAQKRAIAKWKKEKTDEIRFRVPKGKKALIKEHADRRGESVNAFVSRAVDEAMARESEQFF